MIIQLIEKTDPIDKNNSIDDQCLTLPSYYTWQQFLNLEAWLADTPGLRITYLDGNIELMTLGETHEAIKGVLRFLLEVYFVEKNIRFFPVGSATRRDQTKDVSFEPDESYYLGEKKAHPDLAIEVIISSGSINKLEKYRRFAISEVWFWQNNQLSLYHLRESGYVQISRSELLPDLEIDLLLKCLQIPDILEARLELLKGIS
jgi:Uma2 family endonuclease